MTPATCPSCKTEMSVDLSRVPTDRAARVACPSCKAPFTVERGAAPAASAPESVALASAAGRDEAWLRRELEALRAQIEKDVTDKVLTRVLGALGKPAMNPDTDDHEGRSALICEADPAAAAAMGAVLREMGFTPQPAADLPTAWRALDLEQRVVIVTDTLMDDPEAATKLLERLSRLPGAKRRRIFVAYIGKDVQTGDGGVAFVLGANMTISRGELPRFKDLLRRGMAERDKSYRPFLAAMEALAEDHGV